MAIQLQLRRGTATQHQTFTGASGEITENTTNHSVHLHDGSTANGFELARADLTNIISGSSVTGLASVTSTEFVGTNLTLSGDADITGDLSVTGNTAISGGLTITGDLVVNGSQQIINSTVTTVVDPWIEIGGGADGAPLTTNDNKDRGIGFHYYNSGSEKLGFFGWDNSANQFVFLLNTTESNETLSGTYGAARFGALSATSATLSSTLSVAGAVTLTDTTTSSSKTTGALKVAGGLGVAGTLHAGASTLDSLTLTQQLGIAQGGTGQTTLPETGQLLIGNSSNGFTLNRLTGGDYIQITNNSGAITVSYTGTSGNSQIFAPQATSDLGYVYDTNIIAEEDLGAVNGAAPLTYDLGPLRLDGVVSLSNLDQSVKSDYLGYSIIFGF